jgi:GR25 family glycosyltransferase involved in LPS biosynthesis
MESFTTFYQRELDSSSRIEKVLTEYGRQSESILCCGQTSPLTHHLIKGFYQKTLLKLHKRFSDVTPDFINDCEGNFDLLFLTKFIPIPDKINKFVIITSDSVSGPEIPMEIDEFLTSSTSWRIREVIKGIPTGCIILERYPYFRNEKAVTFGLWCKPENKPENNHSKYTVGLLRNIELVNTHYPTFTCHVYIHKNSVPDDYILKLQQYKNVRLFYFYADVISDNHFATKRFLSIDIPEVEIMLSRDADTRILLREVKAVNQWLTEGTQFHIMRDCPTHCSKIMAGMFGIRKPCPNIAELLATFYNQPHIKSLPETRNDADTNFLSEVIYPIVCKSENCTIHDEHVRFEKEYCRYFPDKYVDGHFVGEYVYADESREARYTLMLQNYENNRPPDLVLKYVVLASDLNPDYLDFYPIVRQGWLKIGLTPRLILIADELPPSLEKYKGEVILVPPLPIPTAFQAQCIRLLYPGMLPVARITTSNSETGDGGGHDTGGHDTGGHDSEENAGIIISDMDVYPFDKDYFHKNIINVPNTKFVVYRNVIEREKEYPMCFCAATKKMWETLFPYTPTTLLEWYSTVSDYKISDPYSSGWSFDQKKLYSILQTTGNTHNSHIVLNDSQTGFSWLDRNDKADILKWKCGTGTDNIFNKYTAFHMFRPYKNHHFVIGELINPTDVKTSCIEDFYVLHYSKLVERKSNMEIQLSRENIRDNFNFSYVTQFDRERIPQSKLDSAYVYNPAINPRNLTAGEIANGVAHCWMINEIAKKNCGIIMEDDMILKPNFLHNLKKVMGLLPDDWEAVCLGGEYISAEKNIAALIDNGPTEVSNLKIIKAPQNTVATGCYLLNSDGAQKIVKHPLFFPFSTAIDHNFTFIFPQVDMITYWVVPWLAYEGSKYGQFTTSFPDRGF